MATQRSDTELAVTPLTREQRQRLECMTAVRRLWSLPEYNKKTAFEAILLDEVIALTDYLMTGRKPA